MKLLKLILIVLTLLLLMADQRQIKYFSSERDFLIGSDVPRSEVVRKKHIRAEFDKKGRLILKANVDRKGKAINQEQYTYLDSNLIVRQKDVVKN